MHVRGAFAAQAALSACAGVAAVTFGAPWLGLGWTYDITVNGASFQLGPAFPLGLLAAVLMGGAAALARDERRTMGATGLTLGGAAIFASSLWLLLLWAPHGAPPGQLLLLHDITRLGYALLALSVPLAMPVAAPALARGLALLLGAVLLPLLLFPEHVEQAGVADVRGTLPMFLFFFQGLAALSGTGRAGAHRSGWGSRRKAAQGEPEVAFLRAEVPPARPRKPRQAPKPALRHEPLREALPTGPRGPSGPGGPAPAAKRATWWFQF